MGHPPRGEGIIEGTFCMIFLREVMMSRAYKNPAGVGGVLVCHIRATLGGRGSFDVQYFHVKVECFSR